jgi:hypothetical protein
MLEADGTYHIIDWTLMRFADAEYDIGRSVILWRRAPIDRALVGGPVRVLIGLGRRLLLFRYRRLYRQRRPIDGARLRYYEAFDALRVVAMTFVGRNTSLWRDQPVIDGLMAHVRQCTKLKLGKAPLPPAAWRSRAPVARLPGHDWSHPYTATRLLDGRAPFTDAFAPFIDGFARARLRGDAVRCVARPPWVSNQRIWRCW